MAGIYRGREYHHLNKCHAPHCKTCICHEVSGREKIPSPRLDTYRSQYTSTRDRGCCKKCRHSPVQSMGEKDLPRERYHNVSPSSRIDRKIHSDHKFEMLETWFKRFDFDGNGLIDVYELKSLLNYLGVKCENDYAKELIEKTDRDHDGMLSFSDFLYMWSQATHEDDEDLVDVIKENDLYPDILPTPRHHRITKHKSKHSSHVRETIPRKYENHSRPGCSCCEIVSSRKLISTNTNTARDVEMKKKNPRYPTFYSDDLPVLSCHR